MITTAAVQSIDIGESVAENERRLGQLRAHFVRTPTFEKLRSGQLDLILGAKGMGKSTLFLMLGQDPPPGVRVVAALRPRDRLRDVFDFAGLSDSNEDDLRLLWRAAFLGAAAGAIHHGPSPARECSNLDEYLKVLGLSSDMEEPMLRRAWKAVTRDPAMEAVHADLRPAATVRDLEVVESSLAACLRYHDEQIWVLLDRLDEAFADDRVLEARALRALLAALRDLNQEHTRFRCIAFLRSDVFSRVVADGSGKFVNQTHFMRADLNWERKELIGLIWQRLRRSERFVRECGLESVDAAANREAWAILLRNFLPKRDPEQMLPLAPDESFNTLDWCFRVSSHRFGEYNPRNLVDLLSLAVDVERRHRAEYNVDKRATAIAPNSLRRAWVRLSGQRLNDTVHGEWPETLDLTRRLAGAPPFFSTEAELGQVLGLKQSSGELNKAVAHLRASGVLSLTPMSDYEYQITPLYRPALRSMPERSWTGA